jgi:hypothetical protein
MMVIQHDAIIQRATATAGDKFIRTNINYIGMPSDENSPQGSNDNSPVRLPPEVAETATPTEEIWPIPSLKLDFEERCREIQDGVGNSEGYWDFLEEYQDTVVITFSIANEILKEQMSMLLVQNIMKKWTRRDENVNERAVINNLGNKEKSDMLRHYHIVEPEIIDDVDCTIDYRHHVVHDPQKRHRITNLNTLSERIETARKAVDGLAGYINSDDN